jgi:hypothetical protein
VTDGFPPSPELNSQFIFRLPSIQRWSRIRSGPTLHEFSTDDFHTKKRHEKMPEPTFIRKLMTPEELAGYLRVDIRWIYKRTASDSEDKIPHLKMGKLLRFDIGSEAFQIWLQSHFKS